MQCVACTAVAVEMESPIMRMYYVFAVSYSATSMASTEMVSELYAIHIRAISGARLVLAPFIVDELLRHPLLTQLHSQSSRAFISFFLSSPFSRYYESKPRYSSPFCSDEYSKREICTQPRRAEDIQRTRAAVRINISFFM